MYHFKRHYGLILKRLCCMNFSLFYYFFQAGVNVATIPMHFHFLP